jgi:hypothetical protein
VASAFTSEATERQQICFGRDLADHVGHRADARHLLVKRLDGRASLDAGGNGAANYF